VFCIVITGDRLLLESYELWTCWIGRGLRELVVNPITAMGILSAVLVRYGTGIIGISP
jgi:hypothetical protein